MADDDGNKGDYEIGYGKPPKHTQWKPGQSGNAKGKKSDAPSFKLAIRRELEAQISITDSGERLEVSKMEALAKRLVAEALSGKPRMLTELLRQINIHLSEPAAGDASLPASDEDAALLLAYVRRATGRSDTETEGHHNGPSSDEF